MPGEAGGASSGSDATAEPQALISTSRAQFLQMLTGIISPESIIVEGGSTVPETLLRMLDQTFEFLFP